MKKMFNSKNWRKVCTLAIAVMMLLSVLPLSAMAAGGTVVYLDPNNGWKEANARFAAYWWNSGSNGWVDLVAEGDYYTGTIPAEATGMKFVRMNPATTENNWDNKWNDTGDLTVPTDNKNCFSLPYGAWNGHDNTNWYVKGEEPYNDGMTGPVSYYIAGDSGLCGENWVPNTEANKMTENADGLYEKVFTAVPAGSYGFKVTNGTWAESWGNGGNNYNITLENTSDVTILFNADTKQISVDIRAQGGAAATYTVTIHFMPPLQSWGDTINAWIWAGETSLPGYEEYHTTWPGKAVEADANNPGWYTLEVTTTFASGFSIIFNAGEGNAQTGNLSTGALTGDTELWFYGNECYTAKPSTTPQTGEATPVALLVALMAVSAAAVVVLKKKSI